MVGQGTPIPAYVENLNEFLDFSPDCKINDDGKVMKANISIRFFIAASQ